MNHLEWLRVDEWELYCDDETVWWATDGTRSVCLSGSESVCVPSRMLVAVLEALADSRAMEAAS